MISAKSLDPVLTTSEKTVREEGQEDKQSGQEGQTRKEEAEGNTPKAAAVDAVGVKSRGKPDKDSSPDASAVENDSESKSADGGGMFEVVNAEGSKGEGGQKAMEGEEDKEKEPAVSVPTQRELMEWDEKRNAMELKVM